MQGDVRRLRADAGSRARRPSASVDDQPRAGALALVERRVVEPGRAPPGVRRGPVHQAQRRRARPAARRAPPAPARRAAPPRDQRERRPAGPGSAPAWPSSGAHRPWPIGRAGSSVVGRRHRGAARRRRPARPLASVIQSSGLTVIRCASTGAGHGLDVLGDDVVAAARAPRSARAASTSPSEPRGEEPVSTSGWSRVATARSTQ